MTFIVTDETSCRPSAAHTQAQISLGEGRCKQLPEGPLGLGRCVPAGAVAASLKTDTGLSGDTGPAEQLSLAKALLSPRRGWAGVVLVSAFAHVSFLVLCVLFRVPVLTF